MKNMRFLSIVILLLWVGCEDAPQEVKAPPTEVAQPRSAPIAGDLSQHAAPLTDATPAQLPVAQLPVADQTEPVMTDDVEADEDEPAAPAGEDETDLDEMEFFDDEEIEPALPEHPKAIPDQKMKAADAVLGETEDMEPEETQTEETKKKPEAPRVVEAAEPQAFLWDDFEASSQWAVEAAAGPAKTALSTARFSHGARSLRVEFVQTDRTRFELRRETKLDLTLMDELIVDVYNDAIDAMQLGLALRSGPALKLYESPLVNLEIGWNRDITFDLRAGTFKVDGTGTYDELFDGRDDVRRVSLILHEKENASGVVYIDHIRFKGRAGPGWEQCRPRIVEIKPSAETVNLYEMVELRVRFEASFESYFDPEQIAVTGEFIGPDGRRLSVRGFYDGIHEDEQGRREPAWFIRFAPLTLGRWEYQVTVKNAMGEDVSETARIECAEKGVSHGFVRRSGPDGVYFGFDNGEFYYPMGQNVAWADDYEYYFKKMREHGQNYVRIWMCPWNMMLERAPYAGEYDLDTARQIDRILALAKTYDIYVQLVFDYHGMLKDDSWGKHPYNAENGGPCASPMDFFVNKDAKALYKRRLEYIAARWGAHTHVFAWELFNEVDLTKYYDEDDIVRWHNEMTAHLVRFDPHRHLVTTSSFGHDLTKKLAGITNLNVIQKHLYTTGIVSKIRESWQENYGFRKPYFISEFGGDWEPEMDAQDVRGVTLHAGLWAAFMTPSAGNAMPWWWDTAIDLNDVYDHWTALAAFAHGEDRRNKGHKMVHAALPLSGGQKLEIQGLLCKTELLLWIYDPAKIQNLASPEYTKIPAGAYIWLVGMAEGEYDIEFWDTYTGVEIESVAKRSDLGRLKVVFPEAAKDIACKVKLKGSPAEPTLRLQLDETRDELLSRDARTPR
ncbi:MAG: DUF5060 domain-containing protein [Planctomycetota bacterium]